MKETQIKAVLFGNLPNPLNKKRQETSSQGLYNIYLQTYDDSIPTSNPLED